MMAPLIIACLGETIIERSGILNVGIEGIVTLGSVTGFLLTYYSGSAIIGCIVAALSGSVLTLLLAYFSITLRANQIVIGLGIFVLGLGISPTIYRLAVGVVQSIPQVPTLKEIHIPLLGSIPFIGEIFFAQNGLVYMSYFLVAAVSFFLFKTPLGLRLRACGENPRAADTVGIDVARMRYGACAVGGLFPGRGGRIPAARDIGLVHRQHRERKRVARPDAGDLRTLGAGMVVRRRIVVRVRGRLPVQGERPAAIRQDHTAAVSADAAVRVRHDSSGPGRAGRRKPARAHEAIRP